MIAIKIYALIVSNTVVNLIKATSAFVELSLKGQYQFCVDVTGRDVKIGDVYNSTTKEFTRPS